MVQERKRLEIESARLEVQRVKLEEEKVKLINLFFFLFSLNNINRIINLYIK